LWRKWASAIVGTNAEEDAPGQGPLSTPEQQARAEIDRLLQAAGWAVQSADAVNLHAARGVAIREFPLEAGCGGYMSARRSRSRTHVYKIYRPIQ
jgi:hypothetical protein